MRLQLLSVIYLIVASITLECACGSGTPTPTLPPGSSIPPPTMLRLLYRVVVNGTDRMTTFGPDERTAYPLEAQLYYVPDGSSNGQTALNRMINSTGTDHADAVTSLAGYTLDDFLGYPWSSASLPGLAAMTEGSNSTTGDSAMVLPSEDLAGYVAQPLPVYGYPS